eukprot:TRINITY_DN16985_c0_g2_i1.p1 TRINITY_DN16985_c0_g2~~TRINITY_DN16985_c0_g2_i1.p1  ORF type:complete len:499 (-),score=106.20 TRINITY_DN16985_c0_g2_i1:307-1803(-)
MAEEEPETNNGGPEEQAPETNNGAPEEQPPETNNGGPEEQPPETNNGGPEDQPPETNIGGPDGAAAASVENLADWSRGAAVAFNETGSNDGSIRSIIFWVCMSPWFMLLAVMLIGWNEKRGVCAVKALEAGLDAAKVGSCSDIKSTEGELAFMNCPLAPAPAPPISAAATGVFSAVKHAGYCIQTKYEMYLCEEFEETKFTGTGEDREITKIYTHRMVWSSKSISSKMFKGKDQDSWRQNCRATENPAWPMNFGTISQARYNEADSKAGSWTVTQGDLMDARLVCNAVVPTTLPVVAGYMHVGGGVYQSRLTRYPDVGARRVTIRGDDAVGTMIMGLGKNTNGRLKAWTAPSDWLCSGYDVHAFRTGTITKEEYFQNAKTEQGFLTWFLRLLFFCILWAAWYCLGKPFVDMLDVIPCIGDMLEDFVEAILPIITCPPACACCCFVAGVVWIAMRPLVAIPLLLMCSCLCSLTIVVAFTSMQNKVRKVTKLKGAPGETE